MGATGKEGVVIVRNDSNQVRRVDPVQKRTGEFNVAFEAVTEEAFKEPLRCTYSTVNDVKYDVPTASIGDRWAGRVR